MNGSLVNYNYNPSNAFFDNPLRRKAKNSDNWVAAFGDYLFVLIAFDQGYRASYTAILHQKPSAGLPNGEIYLDAFAVELPATVSPSILHDPKDCN